MPRCPLPVVVVTLVLVLVPSANTLSPNCQSCPPGGQSEGLQAGNITCTFHPSGTCSFQQGCTSAGASPWKQEADWLEVSGTGEDYTSFSTLLSPPVHVQRASCLKFYFAQTLPSKLTVSVNGHCVFPGRDGQQRHLALGHADLPPGNFSIEFRGQNLAEGDTWVRLQSVSLQSGTCPTTSPTVLTRSRAFRPQKQFGDVIYLAVLVACHWVRLL